MAGSGVTRHCPKAKAAHYASLKSALRAVIFRSPTRSRLGAPPTQLVRTYDYGDCVFIVEPSHRLCRHTQSRGISGASVTNQRRQAIIFRSGGVAVRDAKPAASLLEGPRHSWKSRPMTSRMTFLRIVIPLYLWFEHDPPGQARGHAFRKTGVHPASSVGQAFSGSCSSEIHFLAFSKVPCRKQNSCRHQPGRRAFV